MHIPDGFLSPPVWATLDALGVPAVAWTARRAQRAAEDRRIPLMGVMGAFVFAAQMINFPIPLGASGHLVGGALLTAALGPAAASVVMTAILAIQALVFQDGGIMALGANTINMALAGIWAAYVPLRLWGAQWRSAAIFTAGSLSVVVSACLALSELAISGVPMPAKLLWLSLGLFAVNGVLEGAITLAAVRAIERLNPRWAPAPARAGSRALGAVGVAAIVLAAAGVLVGSAAPEVLEKLAGNFGIAAHAPAWMHAPLADYEWKGGGSAWTRRAPAAFAGLALIYGACVITGRWMARSGPAGSRD
ncbi:MAG TPA: energy-coupling factor ABC transporter permease [Bryobacteraceae bacterium]|nr:energy-coupling factor ABC transporter permease [Bryobacteraceae bacterium]